MIVLPDLDQCRFLRIWTGDANYSFEPNPRRTSSKMATFSGVRLNMDRLRQFYFGTTGTSIPGRAARRLERELSLVGK